MCFLYETFPCLVHLTNAMSTWGLTICQEKLVGWPLNNGKGFFQNQLINRPRWHLPFAIQFLVIISGWWETENWKMKQMVMKFPPLRSEWKKRTTAADSLQFPNGFSGKLLFHLTFNWKFWIFFLLMWYLYEVSQKSQQSRSFLHLFATIRSSFVWNSGHSRSGASNKKLRWNIRSGKSTRSKTFGECIAKKLLISY